MKAVWILWGSLFALSFSACSNSDGPLNGPGAGVDGFNCGQPIVPDNTINGCRIRLVTPANCETIDLSGGKSYEVAWTTDGTTCETPWKINLAGNPATATNSYEFQISTNGNTITQKGGIIRITAADLNGIQTDGSYHWVVQSFHGSHPASRQFGVRK